MIKTWALVLAAGEGSRLRVLTTHAGVAVPKQFCSLRGGPSLLHEAILRAEAVVPRERICVVVAEQHRRWWERSLQTLPARNVIVQPENRGTAIGLLLPLMHIAERDRDARVLILPSDHHVREESVLTRALRQTAARIAVDESNLYLLGISPDEADPELGYIVPGNRDRRGALRVSQFIEKPPMPLARAMLEQGAFWNSFILAGAVQMFVDAFERRYPELLMEMRAAIHIDASTPGESIAAADLYKRLPEVDFSRHVLEGNESMLRVQPVPACGWSDLGTPRRVSEALRRLAHLDEIEELTPSTHLSLAAQHARLQLAV